MGAVCTSETTPPITPVYLRTALLTIISTQNLCNQIENEWIKEFSNKSASYFKPYIPIFVQWVDLAVAKRWESRSPVEGGRDSRYFKQIDPILRRVLRPDVAYITVSQNDAGLHVGVLDPLLLANVVVMSARHHERPYSHDRARLRLRLNLFL